MTIFDKELVLLARELDNLDMRATSAFFLKCGQALRPLYSQWLTETGADNRSAVLDKTSRVVERWTQSDLESGVGDDILPDMEAFTPFGDAIGDVPTIGAQACWICYDTALRVLIDVEFNPGPCIEYALEPVSATVSERLFGVSQVGSGPDENAQMAQLLADYQMQLAIQWVRDSIRCLVAGVVPRVVNPHPLLPQ